MSTALVYSIIITVRLAITASKSRFLTQQVHQQQKQLFIARLLYKTKEPLSVVKMHRVIFQQKKTMLNDVKKPST